LASADIVPSATKKKRKRLGHALKEGEEKKED